VPGKFLIRELQELYDLYYSLASSFFNHEILKYDSNSALALSEAKWICCSYSLENNGFWSDVRGAAVSGDLDASRAFCSYMLIEKSDIWESEIEELYRRKIELIDSESTGLSCNTLSKLIFLGGDLWRLKESDWLNISLAKCVAIALNDFFDVNEDTFYKSWSLETHMDNSAEYCSIYHKFLLLEAIAAEADRCEDENLWSWVFSRVESCSLKVDGDPEVGYGEIIRPLSLRCWLKSADSRYLSYVARPFGVFLEDSKKFLQLQAVCSTLFILKSFIFENYSNH